MMYLIKQNPRWFRNNYTVYNQDGETIECEIECASVWTREYLAQDPSGKPLGTIQPMGWFSRSYEINSASGKQTHVEQQWTWFKASIKVTDDQGEIQIEGSDWNHEFSFTRNGQEIAKVTKKAWAWRDTYEVEILNYPEPFLIWSVVAIIDLTYHESEGTTTSSSN